MSTSISYWQKREDLKNDTIYIVGAGIVGLTTAYFLKKSLVNQKITILDSGSICGGASIRNAGFSCFGSPSELLDDIDKVGVSAMIETVKLRWSGLQKLKTIIGDEYIDYNQYGAYELFNDTESFERVASKLKEMNQAVSYIFQDNQVFEKQKIPFQSESLNTAIFNKYEGQLDPYRMIMVIRDQLLKMGVSILNNESVVSIDYKNKIINTVSKRSIQASEIIICTNAYTNDLLAIEDCQPVRNQVYVTKPINGLRFKGNIHMDQGYVYIRSIADRLLIGGARNKFGKTECTDVFGNTEEVEKYLLSELARVFSDIEVLEFEYQWSGILGVGNAKSAIIERHENGAYVGVRLGGMGVAIGTEVGNMLATKIITDLTK